MKNNYNPYSVPDGFFEETRRRAMSEFNARRRRMRYGIAAAAAAVILIATPVLIRQQSGAIATDNEMVADNLADMYQYDIFLQVNFNK